jgi:hypothetical protein
VGVEFEAYASAGHQQASIPRPAGAAIGDLAIVTWAVQADYVYAPAGWTRTTAPTIGEGPAQAYPIYTRRYTGAAEDAFPVSGPDIYPPFILTVWSGALTIESAVAYQTQPHNYSASPGTALTLPSRVASRSRSVYLWIGQDRYAGAGTDGTQNPVAPLVARASGTDRDQITSLSHYVASATLTAAGPSPTFTQRFQNGAGASPRLTNGNDFVMVIVPSNDAPSAPVLTVPATIAVGEQAVVDVGFRDTPGDTASWSALRGRKAGTTAWTKNLSRQSPNTEITLPASTFTDADAGQWEFEGASRDAEGLPVADAALRWSGPTFATVTVRPPGVIFTDPLNGATITGNRQTYTVSIPELDQLEWQLVGDDGGQPDLDAVLNAGTVISDPQARSFTVEGLQNSTAVHARARAITNGLPGPWASIRNLVSFTPPQLAQLSVTPVRTGPYTEDLAVTITNPAAAGGAPAVAYNEPWRRFVAVVNGLVVVVPGTTIPLREPRTGRRFQLPAGTWVDETVPHGVEVQYAATAVGVNGSTSFSAWVGAPSAPGPVGEGDFADEDFDPIDFD